jgi:2-polyprenyl-3-methyl-5-hydroxy-6-metoxy-1,4-benzoquinol methylase
MAENVVEIYGWETAEGPQSCGIITPKVISMLGQIGSIKRVLDLGSGNGKLCSDLSQADYEMVGTDYDAHGVVVAKFNYPDISFYNYGVQDDPQLLLSHENKFDAVVSTEVIEHLFSPHLLPQYAAAVVKENGYLLITTPYHGYLKNLALSIFDKWDFHHSPLWHGGHIKFWSRATLTELLEQNGFRVIAFSGIGRFPYLWKSMVLLAQKRA